MTERERLVLDPADGEVEIGRWLSAFEEVRRDTLMVLREVPAEAVDRDPSDGGDTVGTVLYHVALVEVDWVFSEDHEVEHRVRLSALRDALRPGTG